MNKRDFYAELVDILELEESTINENTQLALDSLAIMSMIAFLDDNFDIQVKAEELKNIHSIGDIITLIGEDKLD